MSHRSLTPQIPVRWLLLAALLAAAWIVVGASTAQAGDRSGDAQESPRSRAADQPRALVSGLADGTDRLRSQVGEAVDSKVVEPLDRKAKALADRVLPSSESQDAPAQPPQGKADNDGSKTVGSQGDSNEAPLSSAPAEPAQRSAVGDVKREVTEAVTRHLPAPTHDPVAEPASETAPDSVERAPQGAPGSVEHASEPVASSTRQAPVAKSDEVVNSVADKTDSSRPVTHVVSAVDEVLVTAKHHVRTATRSLPTATLTESPLVAGLQDGLQRTVSATSTLTRQLASTVDDQVASTATQVDTVLQRAPVVHRLLGDRPVSTLLGGADRTVTTVLDPVTRATDSALDRTTDVVSQGPSLSHLIPAVLPDTVSERDLGTDATGRSTAQSQGQERTAVAAGATRATPPSVESSVAVGSDSAGRVAAVPAEAHAAAVVTTVATPTATVGAVPVGGSLRAAGTPGMPHPTSPQPAAPASPMVGVGSSASQAGAGGGTAPASLPPSITSNSGLIELSLVNAQDWALPTTPSHDPGSSPD